MRPSYEDVDQIIRSRARGRRRRRARLDLKRKGGAGDAHGLVICTGGEAGRETGAAPHKGECRQARGLGSSRRRPGC